MPRHKDENWKLTEEGNPNGKGGRSYSYSTIYHTALFMDLRDELKELNRTLKDQNELLRSIRRNTEEKGRMRSSGEIKMTDLQSDISQFLLHLISS